ncbi:thiol-disulfide oxidoreductase DCC family protein [Sediminibacillus albus]|uniref:Predicted thiol-disulfide oxidoreductase YuxK, DCC family n=1 Tax=Sediminibacillus albus TaxID=407036 RepID=A0A1G8Z1X9_9BACI|nr:DUF393 domain-containing protein [Sediminibacillus albus]SDK09056.1 Predicted thiol-disulfide oxidoreductase YuxK, DCC family [Sediminibacillus albus]
MKSKSIVLYDKDCYLCQQTKKIIHILDWFKVFDWVSLQKYEQTNLLSNQEKEAIRGEIHIIMPNGNRITGYQAVRFMLIRCLLTMPLGILMYIPKSEIIGEPLYKWIAKNRYQLFKNKCTNGVCKIPQ